LQSLSTINFDDLNNTKKLCEKLNSEKTKLEDDIAELKIKTINLGIKLDEHIDQNKKLRDKNQALLEKLDQNTVVISNLQGELKKKLNSISELIKAKEQIPIFKNNNIITQYSIADITMNTNNNNCNVTNYLHLNSDQPQRYNTCNNSKSPNKITDINPSKGNQLVESSKVHNENKDSFLRKIITFKNPFN